MYKYPAKKEIVVMMMMMMIIIIIVKSKVNPVTGHEDPEWE
jgi:hypothetical protein